MSKIETFLKVGSHCQIKNREYFFNLTFNGIFYYNIDDFSIHHVHRFSSETANARLLSTNGILFYEDTIYFFPDNTNCIMKYNIINKQEQFISLLNFSGKKAGIGSVIRQQNKVFLISNESGEIYVLDLHKQIVTKDEELSSLINHGFQYTNAISSNDNCILLGVYGGNKLIEVDLILKKIIWSETLKDDIQIFGICFDGHSYWILQVESTDIYEWNRENNTLQIYTNENIVWEDETSMHIMPYSDMVFLKDEILVLNYNLKNILRVNKEKKTIDDPVEFPEGFRMVNSRFKEMGILGQYTILDDKVLLYPWRGNMLLIYDIMTRQIVGKECRILEEEVPYIRDVCWQYYRERPLYKERDDLVSLTQFIQMITTDKDQNRCLGHENTGRLIHQELK